jgi:hypothetical protein
MIVVKVMKEVRYFVRLIEVVLLIVGTQSAIVEGSRAGRRGLKPQFHLHNSLLYRGRILELFLQWA